MADSQERSSVNTSLIKSCPFIKPEKVPAYSLPHNVHWRDQDNWRQTYCYIFRHHTYSSLPPSITAQTGSCAVVPQIGACNVGGNLTVNVNVSSDHKDEVSQNPDESIRRDQQKLKTYLKNTYKRISEGIPMQGDSTLLSEIYTELYITEGGSGGVNNEHEVRQVEMASNRQTTQENAILCTDIFQPLPDQSKDIRTVLTKGIAGIGKTVSVQKFILDWAEGEANHDVHFIFPLPFRDLNLKGKEFSLVQLLQLFFPEVKDIECIENDNVKVLFIFDGLDECRLPLDFQNNEICRDVTKSTSVEVLLTNLIIGKLLCNALLWITSRPAAASQIPAKFVHRVTEVRGFSDLQKEQYFRKRISDQDMASRIITHMKSSRSLYIMCYIPVFCWISATVLEKLIDGCARVEIPKTLTEMYTHFLLLQIDMKTQKYNNNGTDSQTLQESDREMILKLGQLAFQQLESGNLIFYKNDLQECGLDVSHASVYSGVCTEIFKEESRLRQEKVYCFVHLSIQEYLAALFVFHSCVSEKKFVLRPLSLANSIGRVLRSIFCGRMKLMELHRTAVDQALHSKNGHLDLFLRFLLGLSLDSTQSLLQGLLTQTENGSRNIEETVKYIRRRIKRESSAERTINLFHCLSELNDNTLVKEIQTSLCSKTFSVNSLKPHQCSALAFVLLMSEEVLDVFDLKTYNTTAAGHQRLVPVVKNCRKAILDSSNLTQMSCDIVASALQSIFSHLIELDLSCNNLGDSRVEQLCAGLKSPNCKLQKLRLLSCKFTDGACVSLTSALCSNSSHLRELDLSNNQLRDSGVKALSAGLEDPCCKLETLLLRECYLTEGCCGDLASVLRSPHSELKDLELRDNDLHDSGVRALSAGLEDPRCRLQRLGLSGCCVTERGFAFQTSALRSNPSHLRELDLSYNHPGNSGVLSTRLKDPSCKLRLLVHDGGESRIKPGLRKYACQLTLETEGGRKVKNTSPVYISEVEENPDPWLNVQCREGLSGTRFYWEFEWTAPSYGAVDIAVTNKGIRNGWGSDWLFGCNTWKLRCSNGCYSVQYNNKSTDIPVCPSSSRRVGVYLDWPAGTLSFYGVSSQALILLHRIHTTFTQPVYPEFCIYCDCSVSLCQLE